MNRNVLTALLVILAFNLGSCGGGTSTTTPTTTGATTTAITPTPTTTAADIAATSAKIQAVTQATVSFGLSVYGGRDNAEAKLVATQIQTIVSGTLLSYLSGSQNVSTDVLNTVLKENFITLPAAAQTLISLAGGLLDTYLPAPGANTFLTPQELGYAKAFFQGLSDGAGQYLGNKAAPGTELSKASLPKAPGSWLNLTAKK